MRLIAITSPDFLPDEALRIAALLKEGGFWRVHIRKPAATADALRRLLNDIPSACLPRLVLHDHYELCKEFDIGGIHLNRRHPTVPLSLTKEKLTVSCSCHSLEEIKKKKEATDYVFLSTIFDSISKAGYHSRFSPEELRQAAAAGIIDRKVIALGGVTPQRLPLLQDLHFGGAAMLGAVWGNSAGSIHPRLVILKGKRAQHRQLTIG